MQVDECCHEWNECRPLVKRPGFCHPPVTPTSPSPHRKGQGRGADAVALGAMTQHHRVKHSKGSGECVVHQWSVE